MDCSLPGSSVHGIFQARVLEWVAIYKYFVIIILFNHHNSMHRHYYYKGGSCLFYFLNKYTVLFIAKSYTKHLGNINLLDLHINPLR